MVTHVALQEDLLVFGVVVHNNDLRRGVHDAGPRLVAVQVDDGQVAVVAESPAHVHRLFQFALLITHAVIVYN